jgi:peptidoglycan/xylan/chitin deacetylase (PgdA/CDA1 family)
MTALSPGAAAGASGTPSAAAPCRNGFVGLTYDDGPDPASTMALLNALKAGHARATFFIRGQHAMQYPDLLKAEQAARMWIGSHTFTHPHLTQIGEPAAYEEIASAQRAIWQITGRLPTLFRPPYGETDDQVRADEASLGLTEVLWTVDSRDWAGASTDEIVQAASRLQPGGIILMHDGGYQTTIDAVPRMLSGLASRGLCPGKIVYAPADTSGDGQVFRAVAVAP